MPEVTLAPAPATAPARTLRGASVVSLGVAVPPRAVSNAPIAERLGVGPDWISERTGILERRIAEPEELLCTYAAAAGREALADAGMGAEELDLLIVATITHEDLMPSASAVVAAELGAGNAGAIDLNAACTGFVSALSLAVGQVESGRAESVLVIGADLMSRLLDPDDRGTAAIFADGAGAVVVRAGAAPGRVGPVILGCDGDRADYVTAGREEGVIRMKGHDTFRHAVDRLAQSTLDATAASGVRLEEIDLFIYHQANSRITAAVGDRLNLAADRVIDCVPRYGNTSAGSVPMALGSARDEGRLADGATVLLAAFGAGLTWGATVVEWGAGDDKA